MRLWKITGLAKDGCYGRSGRITVYAFTKGPGDPPDVDRAIDYAEPGNEWLEPPQAVDLGNLPPAWREGETVYEELTEVARFAERARRRSNPTS